MFLPNVISNQAKYWNKYLNLMCSFNFQAVNPRSLKSVLVLLAQILGPFGQSWVFHKFGWVFHKLTENGEFLNRWFLLLRDKNRDACDFIVHKTRSGEIMYFIMVHNWLSPHQSILSRSELIMRAIIENMILPDFVICYLTPNFGNFQEISKIIGNSWVIIFKEGGNLWSWEGCIERKTQI